MRDEVLDFAKGLPVFRGDGCETGDEQPAELWNANRGTDFS